MQASNQLKRFVFPLLVVSLLLGACTTLDYRGVQAQFDQAAQLDNGRGTTAFTASSVATEPGYADVESQLTSKYISDLDERLRPNAYLLLAISQWRMGKLAQARTSAQKGLNEDSLLQQSRDHVLLMMIPGLVIDSEIEMRWREAGKKFMTSEYNQAAKDFKTVFDEFKKAEQVMGPATPTSSRYFLDAQRFRVIQNWRSVINSLVTSTGEFDLNGQTEAISRAESNFGGQKLGDQAKKWRESVPAGHPLRQWMEDLSNQ